MKKSILKIKKNRACIAKFKRSRGFVLLFAVTLAAIFLSIALGVADIALKEINFSTSARDTENAFNAADVGTECALYYDSPTAGSFMDPSTPSLACNGNGSSVRASETPQNFWTFTISGLNQDSQGCAIVTVDKTADLSGYGSNLTSYVIAKGYNKTGTTCGAPATSNTIEREIDTPTF
jgi:Tfp pilus assembly protein PilX